MTELKTGDSLPIWQALFQNQAVWGVDKINGNLDSYGFVSFLPVYFPPYTILPTPQTGQRLL